MWTFHWRLYERHHDQHSFRGISKIAVEALLTLTTVALILSGQ